MKEACVFVNGTEAGRLYELKPGRKYRFTYSAAYHGPPVSLTMPVGKQKFEYRTFPPYFEGLLPEGHQQRGLLQTQKIRKTDLFSQLMAVGHDPAGHVTLYEIEK